MANSSEWIFKKEFLENVNSTRFSQFTDIKKEKENRFKTVWFMQDLTNALRYRCHLQTHLNLFSFTNHFPSLSVTFKRPRPKDNQKDRKEEEAEYDIRNLKVFWTACTFFQRFYVFHSFDSHSRFVSESWACTKMNVDVYEDEY